MAPHRMYVSFTGWSRDGLAVIFAGGFSRGPTFLGFEGVESGDASVFVEADARLGLDDDYGADAEAKCCACWIAIVGASVFLSAGESS